MNQAKLERILQRLRFHPARLEALVAEMIVQDIIKIKEIEFHAKSTFARPYSKDVKNAIISDKSGQNVLQLETHREGIYDQLPQGFFHRPEPSSSIDRAEKRIDKNKVIRKEEANARRFFLPFEQESFYFTTEIENSERELTNSFKSPLRYNLLLDIWPSCKDIPATYYPILCYILPLSYRVAGDLHLMSACYSAIAKYQVKMDYLHHQHLEDKEFSDLEIKTEMELGVDFITTGQPAAELPILEVIIGPIDSFMTESFLPGGEVRSVLDVLSNALVPLDVTVQYKLIYAFQKDTFRLGETKAGYSFLGQTTSLNYAI